MTSNTKCISCGGTDVAWLIGGDQHWCYSCGEALRRAICSSSSRRRGQDDTVQFIPRGMQQDGFPSEWKKRPSRA